VASVHDRQRPQRRCRAGRQPRRAAVRCHRALRRQGPLAWDNANANGVEDGCINIFKAGQIATKKHFGDCQLHVEWATPAKADGNSLNWGNSGVLFLGRYELQIIESHDSRIYADGIAGAVYGKRLPW